MLSLESDRWSKLTHAYGSAVDIPDLLRRLPGAPPMKPKNDDPWYYAWSALCHQYRVSTASYAAVPHLIKMANAARGRRRLDFLSLTSSIEAFRHLRGAPAFPAGLKKPYLSALARAKELAIPSLREKWPEADLRELLGVVAVLSGWPRLGAGIFMGDAEFTCQECDATQVLPGYAEFDS
jgi:hypothetical protein